MPLPAGTRLGPYEILESIGKGGMGEVYRAKDTRLGREVAVKVSAERFSERFEREARLISSLNHPNICTLFDVGPNYLVMELVEGPTLAERIKEGAIPLEEALDLARQIAAALEAAHEKAITHRDLKPGNVKIKPDGSVKVLDFGLAKAGPRAPSSSDQQESPTLSMAATQAGVILGTAAYMAPEQARGRPVDKRADIWAFGVVLYEMVTGQQLFKGEDLTDTLASVVKIDPDVSAAPERVRRVLVRCLEKDPKKRLRDITGVELLLEEAPPAEPVIAAPAPSARTSWAWPAAVAVLLLAAGAAGWGWWKATRPVDRAPMRFSVDMGPQAIVGPVASAVLSPDGMQVAYSGQTTGGGHAVFLRRLDQPEGAPLAPFSAEATQIVFSPDGQWVAFADAGKLKKVSTQGGAAVTLSDIQGLGMTWSDDGNLYIGATDAFIRVPEAGGPGQKLGTKPAYLPHALPGGKVILITDVPDRPVTGLDDLDISALDVKSGARKRLKTGAYFPRYMPSRDGYGGYLLYVSQNTLFGVAFDPDKLELRGVAVPLLDDLAAGGIGTRSVAGQFDVSRTGTLAYLRGTAAGGAAFPMMVMDSAGNTTPVLAQAGAYSVPRFSPDGKKIAYTLGSEIWVYDLERRTPTQLTFTKSPKRELAWSPDGKHLLYGGGAEMWWIRADGGGQPQRLLEKRTSVRVFSTTPDGRVAFLSGLGALETLPLDLKNPENPKPGQAEPFRGDTVFRVDAVFSPDGKFIAYASNESGSQEEVYVEPFPGPGGKWKISTGGGKFPAWSKTAHELLFLGGDNRIMAASYMTQGDAFSSATPRVWSPTPIRRLGVQGSFDVAPDGKHVVMFPMPAKLEEAGTVHITFLLNFADELKRRLGAAQAKP